MTNRYLTVSSRRLRHQRWSAQLQQQHCSIGRSIMHMPRHCCVVLCSTACPSCPSDNESQKHGTNGPYRQGMSRLLQQQRIFSGAAELVANHHFEKSLRLVISFGGLKRSQFLSALEERLKPALQEVREEDRQCLAASQQQCYVRCRVCGAHMPCMITFSPCPTCKSSQQHVNIMYAADKQQQCTGCILCARPSKSLQPLTLPGHVPYTCSSK